MTLRVRTLSLTQCLTDYINFCTSSLLKEKKKRAIVLGNKEEQRMVQRELGSRIREGKNCYRRRMEDYLQQNNISGVWRGCKEPKSCYEGDQKWANNLNLQWI